MRVARLGVALLAGLAPVGAGAQSYTVTRDPAAVGAAGSSFAARALPASGLAPRAQASAAAPLDLASTLGLAEGAALARSQAALQALGAQAEAGQVRVTLPGDVLFDFDKSDIRADAAPVLERLAAALADLPDTPVAIRGHTDAKGAPDYNQALSERRAAAVRSWLAAHDIGASRLSAEGRGEAEPVAANTRPDGADDPEGRQQNRRVEFVIGPGG